MVSYQAKAYAGKFAAVNGLQMYYEIHGSGSPLVLLHGGGSTIESNFGRILPLLVKHYKIVAVELQAHGHTADIDRPLSFEQDADDVAALLQQLKIENANFLGFSNGGTTCLQIGIRHPALVNKIIVGSTIYRRDGIPEMFWEGMKNATLETMPEQLQAAYLTANPDPGGLQAMFHRDVARMMTFEDIHDDLLKSIKAKVLVINGDKEAVMVEHALRLTRTLPNAQLAVLPGGHGDYLGEICGQNVTDDSLSVVVALIKSFL